MEKKTPLRQVLKLSPALDDTLAGAVSLDEKVDAGVDQILAANMDKQLIAVAQKLLEAGKDTVAVPAGIKGSEAAGTALDTFIAQKKAEADKTSEKKPEPEQAGTENKSTGEKVQDAIQEEIKKTEEPKAEPKKRGRPKGSKNKGKDEDEPTKPAEAGPFEEPAATEPTPETPEPAKGGDDIESEPEKGNGPSDPEPEPTIDKALKDDADEPDPAEAWEKFMGGPA
jgi:hypothetical protein